MNATAHPFSPEEIMAFLDGELDPTASTSITAHLDLCEECRVLTAKFRSTSQSLSQWQVDPVDSLDQQRLLEAGSSKIPSDIPSQVQSWLRRFQQLVSRPTPWALACVVFAFLIGAQLFHQPRDSREGIFAKYKVSPTVPPPPASPSVADQNDSRGAGGGNGAGDAKGELQNDTESQLSPKMTIPFAEATPGVAKDSNGLFHGLGDHAQNSFSVDGQPIVDQQSRVFSNPMIARTVSLAVVSKDFDASHKSLEAILARHNGYAASLSVSTPQGATKSIEASLRVPAAQLAATLSELRALGRVENEGQNGEEVTQQHADLVARLKNSRETEQRLQDILVHRTGKISDVLSVEQEIARVRGEIEQMEAEQKNLEHRVDFATINLQLTEDYKAQLSSPAPAVSTLLRNALINGLRTAVDSVLSLVLFFSESGPVVLLWLAILAIPARQLWRRYRRAAAAI